MAEGIIKRKINNPIKSKQISSGITINANGYNYVLDESLAGKNFQGYQIGNIAGKNVTVGQVFIDSLYAYMVLVNNSNVNITTGAITFYYTDQFSDLQSHTKDMAESVIKSNGLKLLSNSKSVDISNVEANEFVVICNYNDSFCYSFTIPKDQLTSTTKRFYDGYGYQSRQILCSISASNTTIALGEFWSDGNNVRESATMTTYYK